MRKLIIVLIAVILIGCTDTRESSSPANTASAVVPAAECMSVDALRAQSVIFVDAQDWVTLPQVRDWTELRAERRRAMQKQASTGAFGFNAFELRQGQIIGVLDWHEAVTVCVQQRQDGYWVHATEGAEDLSSRPWEGPFIPVPGATSMGVAYFDRLFGSTCFQDEKQQRWCFSSGALQIAERRYAAELQLDESEMPGYGSPVKLAQEAGFLIFKPAGEVWQVYRDDFVTVVGHVEVNPLRDKPWRTLRPLASAH
jgi:hypothetical protein